MTGASFAVLPAEAVLLPVLRGIDTTIALLPAYNTLVVLAGTCLLGLAAGVVGTFMLLRGQSLAGDVVSHATLAGVVLAFMLAELYQAGSGRSLPVLLIGAFVAGSCSLGLMTFILRNTRIRQDAAMAVSLGLFYGLGISLLAVAEDFPTGNVAGLSHFLEGMTASLRLADVQLIAGLSLVALVLCGLLYKELRLLSFDRDYAAARGWPVGFLDLLLSGLIVLVAVLGLKAVGAVLVVALLIIPPAAARFWSDRLVWMLVAAAGLGGISAVAGTTISTMQPGLAAGAVIVLSASALFCFSLAFGAQRGLVWQAMARWRTSRRIDQQHLLRAVYELLELQSAAESPSTAGAVDLEQSVTLAQLQQSREWATGRLSGCLRRAEQTGLIQPLDETGWQLTPAGQAEARRVVRNHRLWELYLISRVDIPPSHVDRDADDVEHFLPADVVASLTERFGLATGAGAIPDSPHQLQPAAEGSRPQGGGPA